MDILTYRDLKSKDGLIPLLDHAFNWVFNERQFEKSLKIDPRLKDGPVSFCAVEDGKIIGHVGVMDLATRTLNRRIEHVGGVYGVATLPGQTRRGVCTALMERAHQYFNEEGYHFSFLSTSPALIAHVFYEHLGYSDAFEYPSAYKSSQIKKKPGQSRRAESRGFDVERILEIYNRFVEDKTGFVVRDEAYLKILRKVEVIKPQQCIGSEEGYAVFNEDKTRTWIRELVALNGKQVHALLGILEDRARGPICDRAVLDATLLRVYEARGYMVQKRGYGVIMCKPLASGVSFSQTYGDRFYMSRLDSF